MFPLNLPGLRFGILVKQNQRKCGLSNRKLAALVSDDDLAFVLDVKMGRCGLNPEIVAAFRRALAIPARDVDHVLGKPRRVPAFDRIESLVVDLAEANNADQTTIVELREVVDHVILAVRSRQLAFEQIHWGAERFLTFTDRAVREWPGRLLRSWDKRTHLRALLRESLTAFRVTPNETLLRAATRLVRDSDDVEGVQDEVELAGLLANLPDIIRLLDRGASFETARRALYTLKEAGTRLTQPAFNRLLAKAPDYGTARSLFDEMKASGVEPNETSFALLMVLSPDFATLSAVADEMTATGYAPGREVLELLRRRAPDRRNYKRVLRRMTGVDHRPSLRVIPLVYEQIRRAGLPERGDIP